MITLEKFVDGYTFYGKEEQSRMFLTHIYPQYTLPSRHYHNIEHIQEMLEIGDDMFELTWEQYLAILFHDFIYEPGSTLNEYLSAEYFHNSFRDYSSSPYKVYDIILDTQAHFYPTIEESKIILDLDLERLSRDIREVRMHSDQVRQEFCHYTLAQYNDGRRKFLTNLLNRKTIYTTDYGKEYWEPHLRENVEQLLKELPNDIN